MHFKYTVIGAGVVGLDIARLGDWRLCGQGYTEAEINQRSRHGKVPLEMKKN